MTLDELKRINGRHDRECDITQADADRINRHIDAIEQSRSRWRAKSGDIVEVIDRYGKYSPHWHIDGKARIVLCLIKNKYMPVVRVDDSGTVTQQFTGCYKKRFVFGMLKYRGKRWRRLCAQKTPANRHGNLVCFRAKVNVWEYREPRPLYGKYNTRDYTLFNVYHLTDRRGHPINGNKYRYCARPFTFRTRAEYTAWLGACGGVEFEGKHKKHKIVFCKPERLRAYCKRQSL
jgi:hypothetical protein